MRTRLLRLTALSIGGLAALAGDLPRLGDGGRFAAGFSWISTAHADETETGGSNGEGAPGGGENGGGDGTVGGGSHGVEGGGDGSGSGVEGLEPGGTGAGGGGGPIDGSFSDNESRSSSHDSRDYGPTGNSWHGGSSFLNLFRQTPEEPTEGSGPESSARPKSDAGSRKSAGHTKKEP